MASSSQLGDFLQAQRAKLSPQEVGLPDFGRRRVPGLRREELAQLAGMSVDYYVRLEQGRAENPSPQILDAIGRALRLDATQREHLWRLAGALPKAGGDRQDETVRATIRTLLADVGVPAFLLGRRMDVLAWNRLAAALITDFAQLDERGRSMPRIMFLDPLSRSRHVDWERDARETVEYLRLAHSRFPEDRRLAELIDELAAADPRFARWWDEHEVHEKTYGTKTFRHVVGEITVDYECFYPPGEPDQMLVLYAAAPGSVSATRLGELESVSASAVSH